MTFVELPGAVPAAAPAGVPAAPAPPAARPVRFTGDIGAYWRLLVRSAFLLALTLGIYRFWFSTDLRRFLWAHTEINGESLEYTGTATELLLGFLIAIALLVPINIAFFVLTLSAGAIGGLITLLAFPLYAFLGQYAIYRARRYRLTRTVYRGVRLHQGGSPWRYAVCASFWWLLIALTLGLAYPFAQANLERLKMSNTYYGNLAGRFEGTGWNLFVRGLPLWLLVMGPLALTIAFAIATVDFSSIDPSAFDGDDDDMAKRLAGVAGLGPAIGVGSAGLMVSIGLAVILFPAFQALMLRWWASGVRLGEISIRSHFRTGRIYGAYGRFLLWGLLFSIAGAILFAIGAIAIYLQFAGSGSAGAEITGTIGAVLMYVIMMLGFSTIYHGTVKLTLWRHGFESLEVEGLQTLERVKADGAPSSALGEGLADALNVGGF
jgi:uncharacterized membrane protein YjgN (DUF898 family)